MKHFVTSTAMMAVIFATLQAWAHGPVAEQASVAVKRSTEQFLKDAPKELTEKYTSTLVKQVGDERFEVTFTADGKSGFIYVCGLDETVKPVKWGCKRRL